ncbi:hypothetical protein [Helicobacter sp. 11S02596-1]|uniref:hypothetical protein n=1 Tax=Helicobacter sp. 11S02596-1 TaxID=1476194 RepID=UPI000BA7196B|nr:hypothetical protein [Helicobacter sp. 11S02596-1]PAF43970.1 hypothetical protein BJI48_04080 [Helicobacter sp. 11S02596-1]
MKKFYRYFHMYVSVFFLPLAILYTLSGVLALFEIHGDREVKPLAIDAMATNIDELREQAIIYLRKNGVQDEVIKFRVLDENKGLAYGNIAHTIGFFFGPGHINVFDIRQKGFLAYLMALHTGDGSDIFNYFAILFSACLLLFYVSGLLMIKFSKHAKTLSLAFILGLLVSFVLGILS